MTLSCPQPGNFAAVAKQMHQTAVQVEQRIFEVEQQLRSAVNRPTIVQTSTGVIGSFVANVEAAFGSFSTTFNFTFDNTGTGDNIDNNDEIYIELGEGFYEIGLFVSSAPTGAVTNNSVRTWQIKQFRPDPGSLDPILPGFSVINLAGFTETEPNVGLPVTMAFSSAFRIQPRDRIMFTFLHSNVASTINFAAGVILWMSKVSDSTLTEVL